jgi:hypothetical protein
LEVRLSELPTSKDSINKSHSSNDEKLKPHILLSSNDTGYQNQEMRETNTTQHNSSTNSARSNALREFCTKAMAEPTVRSPWRKKQRSKPKSPPQKQQYDQQGQENRQPVTPPPQHQAHQDTQHQDTITVRDVAYFFITFIIGGQTSTEEAMPAW